MGDKFVALALAKDIKGLVLVACGLSFVQICATGAAAITQIALTTAADAVQTRKRLHIDNEVTNAEKVTVKQY